MTSRSSLAWFIAGLFTAAATAGVARLWEEGDAFTAAALAILAGAGITAWVVIKAIRVELVEGNPDGDTECPACGHRYNYPGGPSATAMGDLSERLGPAPPPIPRLQSPSFMDLPCHDDVPDTGITRAEAIKAFDKEVEIDAGTRERIARGGATDVKIVERDPLPRPVPPHIPGMKISDPDPGLAALDETLEESSHQKPRDGSWTTGGVGSIGVVICPRCPGLIHLEEQWGPEPRIIDHTRTWRCPECGLEATFTE